MITIDGRLRPTDIRKIAEKYFNLGRGDTFNLDDYAENQIEYKAGFSDNISHDGKKVSLEGDLADLEREISRKHETLVREEERLARHTDQTKGAGLDAKKRVDALKKDLEALGKDAQRELHATIEELNQAKTGVQEAHDAKITEMHQTKDAYIDKVHDLQIDSEGSLTGYNAFGEEDKIFVRTKHGDYLITNEGIKPGEGAKPVDAEILKDIKSAAKTKIGEHIEETIGVATDAHAKAQGMLDEKLSHLEGEKGIKSQIGDKTKVMDYNKKGGPVMGGSSGIPVPVGTKGRVGKAAFDEMNNTEAFVARTKANYNQAGGLELAARGAIGLGSLYVAVPNAVEMIKGMAGGTKKDDQGNEVPITGSDIVVAGAKTTAALATLAAALTYGGKNRATHGTWSVAH